MKVILCCLFGGWFYKSALGGAFQPRAVRRVSDLAGTRHAPPGRPSPGRLSRTPHPAEATRAGKPPGKDEFLDVIYWFRQIIAVVLGVIWGILPLRGFLGIAGFCLINAGVLYLYFSNYLQIDAEEYGGTWELTKEGFMTSFALFMVIWIIFYTAIHYDFAPISTVQSKGPFY